MIKIELATTQGREFALEKLEERRKKSAIEKKTNNHALPEGSSMYYYCVVCGCLSDVLPELHRDTPKRLCAECQALQNIGWLDK